MSEAVMTLEPQSAARPSTDVWSRHGGRYRARAILLLCLNVLLFSGVCCFAYWLRTGVFLAPWQEGYWSVLFLTFRFTGEAHVTLASFLLGPMRVSDVPGLIPILGLLVAGMVTIPVVVAILYRLTSSLPFVAVVAFLAVMPWLAITLLGCCVLATYRRFRQRSPFMSAMIALLPVVLYFVLASRGTEAQVGDLLDPLDKIRFLAPWAIAIVSGALLVALVLGIARVVNYRPGAIAPVLTLMFCLPAVLFEFQVGRDELHYRLIEQGNRGFFADRLEDWAALDASADLYRLAEQEWFSTPEPRPRFDEVLERVKLQWSLLGPERERQDVEGFLAIEGSVLLEHQVAFARQCDEFLRYYPDSRYAPNVLFLKASAWCKRVDLREFRRGNWIRFYDDFPHPASAFEWRRLLVNFPDSGLSDVARLRLAQLEIRRCHIGAARELLDDLLSAAPRTLHEEDGGGAATTPWRAFLQRRPASQGLIVNLKHIRLEARRLGDLIEHNNDPTVGYAPLCGDDRPEAGLRFGLLQLDPHGAGYMSQVQAIKDAYPDSLWTDNLDLELARVESDPDTRIERFTAFLGKHAGKSGDAEPEARFLLGAALQQANRLPEAAAEFDTLLRLFPDSPWAAEAKPLMSSPVPFSQEPAVP
ncbi:MAG: hypothetical protein IT449_11425 [Phycisphaerales bacterium]|nr:hypothetical protein [Phycisphaerales bacterium]